MVCQRISRRVTRGAALTGAGRVAGHAAVCPEAARNARWACRVREKRSGDTPERILEKVRNALPVDPRKLDRRIDRRLASIALRCLEKDPSDRYGSADALAGAIRRYLKGEPEQGASAIERMWRWCRRNPFIAATAAALLAFVLILTPGAILLARKQETAKRAQIKRDNSSSAAMVAGTVLSQLSALSDAVKRAAEHEGLGRALREGDLTALKSFCRSTYDEYEDPSRGLKLDENSPFDMWFVVDRQGVLQADSRRLIEANALNRRERNYEWRDYFKGALQLAERNLRSTYVSAVFQSELDRNSKFAISTPIYENGTLAGVLVAAVATQAKLGSLILDDTQRIAVLVAPRDRERAEIAPATPYLILRHPAYEYGEAIGMDGEHIRKLDERSRDPSLRLERPLGLPRPDLVTSSDDYRDPVAARHPEYSGRWIAGFAPVGNTGFVVIVQSQADGDWKPVWSLLQCTALAATPGVVLLIAVARGKRRANTVGRG
jgi:eukaryotic-like serine/threonine-protein kinase